MTVSTTELRTRFAARLSRLYGAEVPAYTTLVEVSQRVNERVRAREGAAAERLGSIDRVTAERHGAIRVGSPRELAQELADGVLMDHYVVTAHSVDDPPQPDIARNTARARPEVTRAAVRSRRWPCSATSRCSRSGSSRCPASSCRCTSSRSATRR